MLLLEIKNERLIGTESAFERAASGSAFVSSC